MYNNDAYYAIWQERSVIADCLRDLGLNDMAKNAHDATPETANKYLAIIQQEAHKRKKGDLLERLHFAGLVYG